MRNGDRGRNRRAASMSVEARSGFGATIGASARSWFATGVAWAGFYAILMIIDRSAG